jgi:hypothetical protein
MTYSNSLFGRTLLLLSIIFLSNFSIAEVVNEDRTYDPNIQTVLLTERGDQLGDPIIVLGSGKQLHLSFDDLSDDAYIFRYTFVHCTANWETSDLDQIEYLDGYFEDDINDYKFSLNAIPQYIHYNLNFPSQDMKIKLSGNYILKVYLDNTDDENVVLTRRFFVVEPIARIEAIIPFYPKKLEYTRLKQQIDLKIHTPDLFSSEPERRINVSIRQNGRWDNMKSGLKPTSIMMNQLDYNYADGIVFEGGNEFRNFDMKSFNYQSPQIRRIISETDGYRIILHTDGPRNGKPYETLQDINGRRYIKARSDQETNIEGEYAWVDFTLKIPKFQDADVFILGELNDWQMDEKSKMRYNTQTKQYYGEMFLKQGYYNYNYVVRKKGETMGEISIIEGDFWDTFNDYKIYVYYREVVPEYDRLMGYLDFKSH